MTMAPGCLKSCPLTTRGEAKHGPPGHWMESEGSEKEKAFLRLWLWICISWMSVEKREGRGERGGQEDSERVSKLVQGQQCGQSGQQTELGKAGQQPGAVAPWACVRHSRDSISTQLPSQLISTSCTTLPPRPKFPYL